MNYWGAVWKVGDQFKVDCQNDTPVLFTSRSQVREYIKESYGYLADQHNNLPIKPPTPHKIEISIKVKNENYKPK